jgi:hypothetical protein
MRREREIEEKGNRVLRTLTLTGSIKQARYRRFEKILDLHDKRRQTRGASMTLEATADRILLRLCFDFFWYRGGYRN